MLFNSLNFFFFFIIVFFTYWFVLKTIKSQNIFLLAASYFFYGSWDWRFLGLIILSSTIDYICAIEIAKGAGKTRKNWLGLSLFSNLGMLCLFKYFNFFSESLKDLFGIFGIELNALTVDIILPVGISFYTFQTLSYTIDIYRKKIEPTTDIITFFTFVSFFPQLVAGPIERASHLIPQFTAKRSFNYTEASHGMRLILWGFFKKLVIADNCSVLVNQIFENYQTQSSLALVMGAFYFALQIYGDFSGYSDIAIGVSKLLGFDLMTNFRTPYFSRDIAEFWRRWHISLSTWFKDYLYIPLGGSAHGKNKSLRNIFIIFAVSGFWHGAKWTFVIWGVLNAIYFIPLYLLGLNRRHTTELLDHKLFPGLTDILSILATFALTCLAWIFFRAENLGDALQYIALIFSNQQWIGDLKTYTSNALTNLIIVFILTEWFVFRFQDFQSKIDKWNKYCRHLFYIIITYLIIKEAAREPASFIYFQF